MIWLLTRSAGVGSYLMLYLAVAWGLLATTSLVTKRVSKRSSTAFHGFVASAGLALLALHLIGLLLDRFVRFDLLDLFVPFRATYRSSSLALGIVAMFATVVVFGSSWTRKLLRPALWRAIHLLAVPAFAMALLHGLLAGSDSARPGMTILYGMTGSSVLFLVIVRGLTARPPRTRPSTDAGRPRADRTGVAHGSTSSLPVSPSTSPRA
jgi:methionine sulfoxide reductase heme-binding subunit